MKNRGKELDVKILELIFLLFGIQILCWVPRFPEIRDQLGANNGQFGSMISIGGIGALLSQFTVGHLTHHFGAAKIMRVSTTLMFLTLFTVVQVESKLIFMILNLFIGYSVAMFNVSASTQVFGDQEKFEKKLLPRMHGFFSTGALLTTIISSFAIGRISPALQVGIVMTFCWLSTLLLLQVRNDTLIQSIRHKDSTFSIKSLFRTFEIEKLVSLGLFCGLMLEFATGDWGSIFARDSLGIKGGLTTLPYITFSVTLIYGRLNSNKIEKRLGQIKMVKLFGLIGGLGFMLGLTLSHYFLESNKSLSFIFALFGFAFGGLGSSFMSPLFNNAGIQRSKLPSSVTLGQIGVINNGATWIMKTIIAWGAQLFSVTAALFIPAILLLCVGLFTDVLKPVQSK